MSEWLQFVECGRRFRVGGLDDFHSGVSKAAFEVERLIAARCDACRAALERFYGRPAHEFAERANGLLAAMVDLHLVLAETARLLYHFPEDRLRLVHVVESARGTPGVVRPRFEPPAGPPSRVGADLDALRRYGDLAGHMDEPLNWLARVNDLDDVSAWQERSGSGLFDTIQRTVAAVPGMEVPVEWERMNPAALLPMPDLVPLIGDIRARSQATAELAFATADAFGRADAELVALLEQHPDLAGYVSSALGPRQMGGGAALAVVAAHFPKLDNLRDGRRSAEATKKALARLATDAKVPDYLRDAARRLKDSPALLKMVAGPDGVLTRRDVLRHLADMRAYATAWEHLAVFDTAAKSGKPDGYISRGDLAAAAKNRALSAEVRKAAALLLRRVDAQPGAARGARVGIHRDDIVRHLVDGQAFADDPAAARRFVESLPVADDGKKGLPVGLCSADGVKVLANAALESAAGSLTAQQRVIAHLPETDKGTRNSLITAFYDVLGDKVDSVLAGPAAGNPQRRGHPGANWLMYAPWASNGVRTVITGDVQVFGMGPRQEMRQGAADGNQWIFNDITARFAAFVEMYESNPAPSAAQLEQFFAEHFHAGDAEIRKGFTAYVAAMAEEDPARRQALTFEGNVSVATHEQAGVQPYLEKVGNLVPDGLESRYIDLQMGRHHVEVDRSVPTIAGRSNLVAPMEILDLDPARRSEASYSTPDATFTLDHDHPGPGVVHLAPMSGVEDFPTSMADWHAKGSVVVRPGVGGGPDFTAGDPDSAAGSGARAWADPNERMWTITKLFEQTHTDQSLWNTDRLQRSFDDFSWLTEEARPR